MCIVCVRVRINRVRLNLFVLGSCFRTLAVILFQIFVLVVFVQVELQVVLRTADDNAHTHVVIVNVGVEEEVLDEVLHDKEVVFRDACGNVQNKLHVHQGIIALWTEWGKW